MLVFVVTNELFDSYLAEHFRKLAIDKDKAGEMILVVNKMDRASDGNTEIQQNVIREDLRKVLTPYTPEQLNLHNLFAAILAKGISRQLKEGLYREYLNRKEDVAVVRGKIDMPGTIQNRLSRRRVLTCEYDELSENNLLNQILKTTVTLTTAIPAASYSIWKRCCIWMAVPAAHHGATPSQRISMSTVVTFTLSPRPKQLP